MATSSSSNDFAQKLKSRLSANHPTLSSDQMDLYNSLDDKRKAMVDNSVRNNTALPSFIPQVADGGRSAKAAGFAKASNFPVSLSSDQQSIYDKLSSSHQKTIDQQAASGNEAAVAGSLDLLSRYTLGNGFRSSNKFLTDDARQSLEASGNLETNLGGSQGGGGSSQGDSLWGGKTSGSQSGLLNANNPYSAASTLNAMLADNSPLMQRAAMQGRQAANSRGLLNSSMASGAAQGAMIDRATPLAQQDAQYWQNRGLNEQQQGYQQANMQLDSELQEKRMQLSQALEQGNMELANQLQQEINEQQQGYQQANMQLDSNLQEKRMQLSQALEQGNMELANQLQQEINEQQYEFQSNLSDQQYQQSRGLNEQQFNNEMQRMGYAYELDQRNIPQNYAANISAQTLQNVQAIQADPNLEPAAKQAAIKNAIDMANANMSWAETFYNTPMPALRTPGAA